MFPSIFPQKSRDDIGSNCAESLQTAGSILAPCSIQAMHTTIRRKGRNPTVTDPHNGLKMRLWEEDDVKKFVHEQGFLIRYFFKLEFEDIVQGTPFKRSIIAFLAKKLLVS